MKVPPPVLDRIRSQLWQTADKEHWPTLPNRRKSALFEQWIRDDRIGGVLSRYLDSRSVRVYLKDTIMKRYMRDRIKDFAPVTRILDLPEGSLVSKVYLKPHGRRLTDGKVICWGLSRDWKTVLMAVFERAHADQSAEAFAAVIMFPVGKCRQPAYRRMIESASVNLGIKHLEWYEE